MLVDLRRQAAAQRLGVDILDVRVADAAPSPAMIETVSRRMQDAEARQVGRIKADGEQHKRELLAQADRDAADVRGEAERQALEIRGDGRRPARRHPRRRLRQGPVLRPLLPAAGSLRPSVQPGQHHVGAVAGQRLPGPVRPRPGRRRKARALDGPAHHLAHRHKQALEIAAVQRTDAADAEAGRPGQLARIDQEAALGQAVVEPPEGEPPVFRVAEGGDDRRLQRWGPDTAGSRTPPCPRPAR